MVIPAGLIEFPFRQLILSPPSLLVAFLVVTGVVGLGEESLKILAVRMSAYRTDEFNEVLDGVLYGAAAALGFAATENVLYTVAFGWQVGPVRAVITSLAHSAFTGVAGFYLGLAKLRGGGALMALRGVAIASVLHGVYDFLLLLTGLWVVAALGLILFLLIRLDAMLRKARELSPFRPD